MANKNKKTREHEVELATLKLMAADPEMKYFLGVAGGAGIATIGALIKNPSNNAQPGSEVVNAYEWMLGAGSPVLAAIGAFDFNGDSNNAISNLLKLSGGSFAGFCASVLLLKAMSGGQDGAGILGKLVGGVL